MNEDEEKAAATHNMDWIKRRFDFPFGARKQAESILHWNMGDTPEANFAAFLRAPVSHHLCAATRRELASRGFHYPKGHSDPPA